MLAGLWLAATACAAVAATAATGTGRNLPTVEVTSDDTAIKQSCRIVIPAGTVIEDTNGDGVIQIAAPNIEVEFAGGSELRGSKPGTPPDQYKGYGIRLNGHSGVTIRGGRLSGYWCGLHATKADKLTLEGVDASDNRRARLRSTPTAEDGADWLFPHRNDDNEWLKGYGAAIYVEDSNSITVRNCRVRHGQNALCLDRVADSKVYDNDFSFNSGWGIAMWRCAGNTISRNAVDFCIRGYSHKVYNRGQDSAGILVFEQNNRNVIAENSATHGGDGLFGFAGLEALGDIGKHPPEWYKRRGNSDNLIVGNDFSYAAAHGIEMTFSSGNRMLKNRLVENAICGVWGGYSQDTLIAGNAIEGNGEMGYGLERGGVNIEHGKGNRITGNKFQKNRCGVHLWWGKNEGFLQKPWAKANGEESTNNLIAGNEFIGDQLVFHFRGASDVTLGDNAIRDAREEMRADADVKVIRDAKAAVEPLKVPEHPVYGSTKPVGGRAALQGRQNIIMTDWGPWDHASPLVRLARSEGTSVAYELLKMPGEVQVAVEGDEVTGVLTRPKEKDAPVLYAVQALAPGARPYIVRIKAGAFAQQIRGTLVATTWTVTFFTWPKETDPRKDLEGWRKLAAGPSAVTADVADLRFRYGLGGPSDLRLSDRLTAAKIPADYFGMVAKAKLLLPKGKWQFTTLSDDGIRVLADDKPVIENWTWHVPTRNTGTLDLPADKTVEIVAEHFEIDGVAAMELDIAPAE